MLLGTLKKDFLMFLAFRVKNFRSIRDALELEFRRTKPLEIDEDLQSGNWDLSVNAVTAIYGANASGKTSILDALGFFLGFIDDSQEGKPGAPIEREAFVLDASSRSEPTELELEFLFRGVRHQYGFSVSDTSVQAEWLYVYNSSKRTILFDRDSSEENPYFFGRALKGQNQIISTLTRSNALFLSSAATNAHPMLTDIYRHLDKSVGLYNSAGYEAAHKELTSRMYESESLTTRLLAVLQASDTGISNITIDIREMSPNERKDLAARLVSSNVAKSEKDADGLLDRFLEDQKYKLQFQHLGSDGEYPLSLENESTGTRALLSHADAVFHALDSGGVCIFDEIDTSLHPMLVAELVSLFQSPATNPLQAQLIFTTHEDSLLDASGADERVLDREQVWVTDKDRNGVTKITPLSDFKPRTQENLRRGYRGGRYGGLPLVHKLRFAQESKVF